MNKRILNASAIVASLVVVAVLFEVPVSTHHSFAMYDQTKVVTLTGVVKQFVPQANHAEIHFLLLAPDHKSFAKAADGKNVEWGLEMAGAAAVAQQGITATTFGVGTVFSVKLNPLRDGSKCPTRSSPSGRSRPGNAQSPTARRRCRPRLARVMAPDRRRIGWSGASRRVRRRSSWLPPTARCRR